MTRMLRATLIAAAAVVLAAGCASQQEPQVQRAQPTDPGYGPVIGDVKDGRTRAKAHTDLAAAYYELGNLGVALEEARIALAADPSYPPAYNVQGLVSMELKDQAGADASFQRGAQARTAGSRPQPQLRLVPVPDRAGAAVDPVVHERDQEPALPDAVEVVRRCRPCLQKGEPGGVGTVSSSARCGSTRTPSRR